MTRASSENLGAVETNRRGILLLGDDGRMAHLLRGRFKDYPLYIEENVLEGIVRQGQSFYETILLNAERLGEKTVQAVKALRRVSPTARLLVFGEAFTEVYGKAARAAGADDYLIWPVPAAELRSLLKTDQDTGVPAVSAGRIYERGDSTGSTTLARDEVLSERKPQATGGEATGDLLGRYRELAQLIPKGQAALIEQAQRDLAEALQVEWVTIHLAPANDAGGEQESDPPAENEQVVRLNGPSGFLGRMRLGPTRQNQQPGAAAVQTAVDFLGTLLHLSQRDENLKRLATVDELTGAYNRRYLEYFLRQVMEQSKHEHTEVALLIFDIDEFKHYNDTYGHGAGDEILCEATKLMRRCCREHDVVARMGGDEFAVLFWDTGQPREVYAHHNEEESVLAPSAGGGHLPICQATKVNKPLRQHPELAVFLSNRFRRIMNTSEFPSLGPEARGMLTISGGLACFPWDGDTVEQLLAKADEALLSAKRSGKNRIYLVGRPNEKNQQAK